MIALAISTDWYVGIGLSWIDWRRRLRSANERLWNAFGVRRVIGLGSSVRCATPAMEFNARGVGKVGWVVCCNDAVHNSARRCVKTHPTSF